MVGFLFDALLLLDWSETGSDVSTFVVKPFSIGSAGLECVMGFGEEPNQGGTELRGDVFLFVDQVVQLVRIGMIVEEFFTTVNPFNVGVTSCSDAAPFFETAARAVVEVGDVVGNEDLFTLRISLLEHS